jgi:hypothetical protein
MRRWPPLGRGVTANPVVYRAGLDSKALTQLNGFPQDAMTELRLTMGAVVENPWDPLVTLPGGDAYERRALFGGMGIVTFTIDDANEEVTVTDITWAG